MKNMYGDISPRTATKASKKLLSVGQPIMALQRTAMVDNQEMKSTKSITWRRYHNFPAVPQPMAEGVTPPGRRMTYSDYTATLEWFGDVVEITDTVQDTHEDPILRTAVRRCGEQAAETIEVVTFDELKAGTNVYYAGSATSRATVDAKITRGDLRKVTRGFARHRATKITEIVSPTPKISTQGVEASFFAYAHTDLDSDIRDMTGFKQVVEYGNPGQAVPGECGSVEQVRFILSSLYEPWEQSGASSTSWLSGGVEVSVAAQADVYPVIVVARDSYATVRLQGRKASTVYVLNPNIARGADPLGRQGTVGWKIPYACAILNEMWIARIEVAATADLS